MSYRYISHLVSSHNIGHYLHSFAHQDVKHVVNISSEHVCQWHLHGMVEQANMITYNDRVISFSLLTCEEEFSTWSQSIKQEKSL